MAIHIYKLNLFRKILGNRTLTKFADEAGISAGNLSRIANGQNASLETIRKMADASNGIIDYERLVKLFGFKGDEYLSEEKEETFRNMLELEMSLRGLELKDFIGVLGEIENDVAYYIDCDGHFTTEDVYCVADYLNVPHQYLLGDDTFARTEFNVSESLKFPILGVIYRNTPLLSSENITGYVELRSELVADYIVSTPDNSLNGAGLDKGDLALITAHKMAKIGDLVAVRNAEEDQTPKLRFFNTTDSGVKLFKAANPDYPDTTMDENSEIIGIASHIIKRAPKSDLYQNRLNQDIERDSRWSKVIETATSYGLDAESVNAFISAMHMMIKAASK